VYGALTLKQARQLQGNVICGITNQLYPKSAIPAGSFYVKYELAEIITPEGIAGYVGDYQKDFIIISANTLTPKEEVIESEPNVENNKPEIPATKEGESFEERKQQLEDKDARSASTEV